MITEYKGYTITNRDDFKVQEFGESLTLFLFDPALFEIDSQEMREFGAALLNETNAAFTLLGTEIEKGIITLIVNPTVEHFYTNEFLKDAIIRFIFDHRTDDDFELI